jgi:high-affinity K+ transport system ATPase subunit B
VLSLSSNSLTGTIPTEIALMSNLCEYSLVWLLVVIVVMCFSLYSHACLSFFHSTAWLSLFNNSLTGTIPSQTALMSNLCESSVVCLLVVMIV